MKILSLFDGMSVAQQALKNIGADVEVYYASEIDDSAMAVTQSNFPATKQLGSVVNIAPTEPITDWLGSIDIMVGGSPCQDLSIAKKGREGLSGSRSGLFWEYVRIRDEVKPKYFILENVASMPKEAKDTISEALGVEPVMINASLVSAQNRKRLFWVGKWNGGKYEQVEIPLPKDRGILLKDILEENVDSKYNVQNYNTSWNSDKPIPDDKDKYKTLRTGGDTPTVRLGQIGKGGQGDRIYSQEGKSVSLSANGGGRGAKTGLYAVGVASRTYPRTKIEGQKRTKQIEVRSDEKANSMTSVQGDSMVAIVPEATIRKLTPTECLRLQSMPDDYFDKAIYKNKPISNTQRYKMCGNAFNCKVIEHILKSLN
jgi:DNA-cytosine methyltransferase